MIILSKNSRCSAHKYVEKIEEKFGKNKFDFSLVEYINKDLSVKIKCNECRNVIQRTLRWHLESKGCPFCWRKTQKHGQSYDNEIFIDKAKKVHGNKYDYSLINYTKGPNKVKIICKRCLAVFDQVAASHLFGHGCSKCFYKTTKGKNNVHWNPKLTDEERVIKRKIDENRKWRELVFQRDKYRCQITDKNGYVEAHHLESYHTNIPLRFDVSNGITICQIFHKLFHKIYGNKNNNRQQFEEFVESLYLLL